MFLAAVMSDPHILLAYLFHSRISRPRMAVHVICSSILENVLDPKQPADYAREFERHVMTFLPEPHDFNSVRQGWYIDITMFNPEGFAMNFKPDIKWKSESELKSCAKRIVRSYLASLTCDKIVNSL